jgi:hypothetical protein
MVAGDRDVCALFLAVLAALEDHLEGDVEQQQAAGHPEGGQGDAEHRQDNGARDGEQGQHEEADDGGAQGDLTAFRAVHAPRQHEEQRGETGRLDRDEDGHEGVEETVIAAHFRPPTDERLASSRRFA